MMAQHNTLMSEFRSRSSFCELLLFQSISMTLLLRLALLVFFAANFLIHIEASRFAEPRRRSSRPRSPCASLDFDIVRCHYAAWASATTT